MNSSKNVPLIWIDIGEKVEEKKRVRKSETKIISRDRKHAERIQTTNVFTPSMAKKIGDTASASKIYPNRRGRENKYSGS